MLSLWWMCSAAGNFATALVLLRQGSQDEGRAHIMRALKLAHAPLHNHQLVAKVCPEVLNFDIPRSWARQEQVYMSVQSKAFVNLKGFVQIMCTLAPSYLEDDLPAVQSMTNTALSLSKGLGDLPTQVDLSPPSCCTL